MRTGTPIVRPSRRSIVQRLRAVHARLERVPTRTEFYRLGRLPAGSAERAFGGWTHAVRAAGLKARTNGVRVTDEELFGEWGAVTRTLGRVPSLADYKLHAQRDAGILRSRCRFWSGVPHAFLAFAGGRDDWRDVVEIVGKYVEGQQSVKDAARGGRWGALAPDAERATPRISRRIVTRAVQGGPLRFRSLAYEPDCELGVVLMFGVLAADLGYYVEKIRASFPDCEAVRRVGEKHWQRVRIEFELESRNFRDHRHAVSGCDVIVCWRHNWPECPEDLEVVELSKVVRDLRA